MKQLLLFASALALATACTTTPKGYSISGTAPDSTFNGQYVYLHDYVNGKMVDSSLVENGKFSFTGVADTPTIYRMILGRSYSNVIAANEEITVALDPNQSTVSSTGLNGQLGKLTTETSANMKALRQAYDSLSRVYPMNSDSFKVAFGAVREEATQKNAALYDTYLAANKDNMLGVYCLWTKVPEMSLSQIDSAFVQMPLAKNFTPILKVRTSKENAEMTSTGKMFVDFKGKDTAGKEIALSEFVGKGNYVLADFWASWCGPCRAEMPNLKELHNKYKDKGLIVLGVNVWDSKEKSEQAREAEGMTWSHLYASDNNDATTLYGIEGIPQIILFAPDGTIVARDLRGEDMKAKIAEVYAKK
ncbi:MAG: redoxin domain-containing protein [Bacteroidales bacterium]